MVVLVVTVAVLAGVVVVVVGRRMYVSKWISSAGSSSGNTGCNTPFSYAFIHDVTVACRMLTVYVCDFCIADWLIFCILLYVYVLGPLGGTEDIDI